MCLESRDALEVLGCGHTVCVVCWGRIRARAAVGTPEVVVMWFDDDAACAACDTEDRGAYMVQFTIHKDPPDVLGHKSLCGGCMTRAVTAIADARPRPLCPLCRAPARA